MLDPFANRWMPFPPAAPFQVNPTVAWTGQQIVVWGGSVAGSAPFQTVPTNTGYALNRATNEVVLLPTAGAPSARVWPLSVWTGEELLVWGGRGSASDLGPWVGGPVYALAP